MYQSFAEYAADLLTESKSPSYGCLMAFVGPELSGNFVDWTFDNIESSELKEGKDSIEQEPHVTILYGFHEDVTADEVFDAVGSVSSIDISLGKISKFKQDDQDVVKIEVESHSLRELNALMRDKFADRYTNNYPDYTPHLTLAYVVKDGASDIDESAFEGEELTITRLVYSYPEMKERASLDLGVVQESSDEDDDYQYPEKIVLPDAVDKAFNELANEQRGEPESAMLKATSIMPGMWAYGLEHIGDLTHRMAQHPNFYQGGEEYVAEKVKRMLRYLRNPYGFAKEVDENLRNNFEYRHHEIDSSLTWDAYMLEIKTLVRKYSEAHSKLVVYNRAQWLAREAAIAMGRKQFDRVESYLAEIDMHLGKDWAQFALQYQLDSAGNLIPYNQA